MILYIDTSSSYLYAAIVENGKIRKTRYENYKKFIESIEELKR